MKTKESPHETNHVRTAFNWLLNSGIQIQSQDPLTSGGVCAWYDSDHRSYPFIYAEITGYAVNAFLFQHRLTGDKAYLTAAVQAGDWLLRNRCSKTGLVKTRHRLDETQTPYYDQCYFTFDQWVIVYGLACLAGVSGEPRFLDGTISIAKFLLDSTVKADGFFYPLFDSAKQQAVEFGDKWSRQPGSFHAKALMALAKLSTLTKETGFREYAERLLRKTVSIQFPDGRFVTQDDEQSTHLHPFLYTLEGIASYAVTQQRRDLLEPVESGARWILDRQNDDGTVYCFYRNEEFSPFVRADVLAQTLRIGSILTQRGFLTGYSDRLTKLRNKLESYQLSSGPQLGGFRYGQEENGAAHNHINAWVTMFAAQAISIHDRLKQTQPLYDMEFFV